MQVPTRPERTAIVFSHCALPSLSLVARAIFLLVRWRRPA